MREAARAPARVDPYTLSETATWRRRPGEIRVRAEVPAPLNLATTVEELTRCPRNPSKHP